MSFAANIIDYFNLNEPMIFVNMIFIMNEPMIFVNFNIHYGLQTP